MKRVALLAVAVALGSCSSVDLGAQLERERSIMAEYVATVIPDLALTTTETLTMQTCPPDGSQSHTIEATGPIAVDDVSHVLERSAEYIDAKGWSPATFTDPPSVSGRTEDNAFILSVRAYDGQIRVSVDGVECGFP